MKGSIPSENKIQERAYELYILRGAENGHDVDDWLNAERELSAENDLSEDALGASREVTVTEETTLLEELPETPSFRVGRAATRSK